MPVSAWAMVPQVWEKPSPPSSVCDGDSSTGWSAMDGLYLYRPFTFPSVSLDDAIQECRTVLYTPPVSASVARIEKEVLTLFAAFSYLVEAANQRHQGKRKFLEAR